MNMEGIQHKKRWFLGTKNLTSTLERIQVYNTENSSERITESTDRKGLCSLNNCFRVIGVDT